MRVLRGPVILTVAVDEPPPPPATPVTCSTPYMPPEPAIHRGICPRLTLAPHMVVSLPCWYIAYPVDPVCWKSPPQIVQRSPPALSASVLPRRADTLFSWTSSVATSRAASALSAPSATTLEMVAPG